MGRLKQSDNQKPEKPWRICAIFAPQTLTDSTTTVDSTLHLLEPLAEELFAITGNFPGDVTGSDKIHFIDIKTKENPRSPMLVRISRFIMQQLKISCRLIKIASGIDIVFLAAGTAALFLPALTAKLLRKKVILLRHGTDSFQERIKSDYRDTLLGLGRGIFPAMVHTSIRINCSLADRIAVFSPNITDPRLKGYAKKISVSGSRFYLDIDTFKVEKSLDSRDNLVGYIGRFEEIKGVMNFVKAIPLILGESPGIKILLGGDGPMREEIEKHIEDAGLGDRVVLAGWIPHDRLPQQLNEIRLLVIPSYAEAGPHIVFEAMACGTPVLAAPVGVMPDVIKDGETGFILEDNSPECIAQNTIRALNHPNLNQIIRAARELIERDHTHEAAVERYRSILASLK